jgi:hypothetical protein
LEQQLDLVSAGERLAQFGEQGQAVGAGVVAGRLVPGDARAVAFGLVHRDVGAAKQLGDVDLAGRRGHDADRRLDRDLHAGHRGGPGQLGGQVPGPRDRLRRGRARTGEQHGELVAAEPHQQVAGRSGGGEPGRGGAQQVVSGGMAERGVDLFEVVDVQQEQRHRRGRVQAAQHFGPAAEQRRTVGQAGQGVVRRVVGAAFGQRAERAVGRRVVQGRRERVAVRVEDQAVAPGQQRRLQQTQLADARAGHEQRPHGQRRLGRLHRCAAGDLAVDAERVRARRARRHVHDDLRGPGGEQARHALEAGRGGMPLVEVVELARGVGERLPRDALVFGVRPVRIGLVQQPERRRQGEHRAAVEVGVRPQPEQPARGDRRRRGDHQRRHVVDDPVPAVDPAARPVDQLGDRDAAQEHDRHQARRQQVARGDRGRLAPAQRQHTALGAHPHLQDLGQRHQREDGERRPDPGLRPGDDDVDHPARQDQHRRDPHRARKPRREHAGPGHASRRRGAGPLGASGVGVGRGVRGRGGAVCGRRGGFRTPLRAGAVGAGALRGDNGLSRDGLSGDGLCGPDGTGETGCTLVGHARHRPSAPFAPACRGATPSERG